jgi:hypothetical protein
MSSKLFQACLLPFICAAVIILAGWVRQRGLELPAACLATLGAIPFFGARD